MRLNSKRLHPMLRQTGLGPDLKGV